MTDQEQDLKGERSNADQIIKGTQLLWNNLTGSSIKREEAETMIRIIVDYLAIIARAEQPPGKVGPGTEAVVA